MINIHSLQEWDQGNIALYKKKFVVPKVNDRGANIQCM